jgi:hypothetical protein
MSARKLSNLSKADLGSLDARLLLLFSDLTSKEAEPGAMVRPLCLDARP